MEITAPAHWRCVELLSDIHLDAAHPATAALWLDWLAHTPADAVFLLGDVFEVWVGDDALEAPEGSFVRQCASALYAASRRLALYMMVGNRDFLMGKALMAQCGAVALDDPSVLVVGGQRVALSHGDALCTGDVTYQNFRHMVRSAAWQSEFLAQPLAQRRAVAASIRAQSELRKHSAAAQDWADVDPQAACALLQDLRADTLIHGHTHRPGTVHLPGGKCRMVLSDWDAEAAPARADLIRLSRAEAAGDWHTGRIKNPI